MAEDREGMQPEVVRFVKPEAAKGGVRESVVGVLNTFIDKNPVVREQARSMDRVQAALPEGRVKDAVGLAVDAAKIPKALIAFELELIKRMIPLGGLLTFVPEQLSALGHKAMGFVAETVVESGPVQAGVRTVDSIVDGILGERRPAPVKATIENSRQILVGMARPEMGKQERRKMA